MFEKLLGNVTHVHDITNTYAIGADNQLLTVRNWMIGYYIVEFEQHGLNRAEYGTNLLEELSRRLSIKGIDRLLLNLCRIFYLKYPQICATVSHKFEKCPFFGSFATLKVLKEINKREYQSIYKPLKGPGKE